MAATGPRLRRNREEPCGSSIRAEQAVSGPNTAQEYSGDGLGHLPPGYQEETDSRTINPQRDCGGDLHVLPPVRCSEDSGRDCVSVDFEQERYRKELQVHAPRAWHVRASFR